MSKKFNVLIVHIALSLAAVVIIAAAPRPALSESLEELLIQAEHGDSIAQYELLGGLYYPDADFNDTLTKAEHGDARAQYTLGVFYKKARDDAEAVKWYRKAADQGYAPAQCQLGFIYDKGRREQGNNSEAVKWYRKAADQGYSQAQNNLGILYQHGREGAVQDYSEAAKWYRRAAELGHKGGMYNLGVLYENGWGVVQDYSQALAWYTKAAELGHYAAYGAMDRVSEFVNDTGPADSRYDSGSASYWSSSQSSQTEIHELCIRCSGRKKIRCSACDGRGGREEFSHAPNYSGSTRGSGTVKIWRSCSKCYGSGEVDCPVCGGKGYTVRYN